MKLADLFSEHTPLVVKEMEIDENAERQVKIVARKGGFVSFVLSLLRIDSTFALCVYPDRVESTEGTIGGRMKTVMPSASLDTCTYGEGKPWQYLTLGLLLFFLNWYLFNSLAVGVVFVFICFVLYLANRYVTLTIATKGSTRISYCFAMARAGGVLVDEALAGRVCEIIRRNHLVQTAGCKEKQ